MSRLLANRNIRKDFDLCAVSDISYDDVTVVDRLVTDGRSNFLRKLPSRLGGLSANGLCAVTELFSLRSAIGTVIGDDDDGDAACRELESHGVSTAYVESLAGRQTCRNTVIMDESSRLCVRNGNARLSGCTISSLKSVIARSRCAILRVNSTSSLAELSAFGRRLECVVAIVPTDRQLNDVAELACDLLACNVDESRHATSLCGNVSAGTAFRKLINLTDARYVVQTGGGTEPTLLFDRDEGRIRNVMPANTALIRPPRSCLNPCGTGDVALAATCSRLLAGETLADAFANWGRLLATAHLVDVKFATADHYIDWLAEHSDAFSRPSANAA